MKSSMHHLRAVAATAVALLTPALVAQYAPIAPVPVLPDDGSQPPDQQDLKDDRRPQLLVRRGDGETILQIRAATPADVGVLLVSESTRTRSAFGLDLITPFAVLPFELDADSALDVPVSDDALPGPIAVQVVVLDESGRPLASEPAEIAPVVDDPLVYAGPPLALEVADDGSGHRVIGTFTVPTLGYAAAVDTVATTTATDGSVELDVEVTLIEPTEVRGPAQREVRFDVGAGSVKPALVQVLVRREGADGTPIAPPLLAAEHSCRQL